MKPSSDSINAIRLLLKQKHAMGYPFMINVGTLPQGQFYLQYPDLSIALATIETNSNEYKIIKKFDLEELKKLKDEIDKNGILL